MAKQVDYTISEAATLLGVTRARVLQLLKEGRFGKRPRKRGGVWLLPGGVVERFAAKPRPIGNPNWRKGKGA